MLRYFLHIKNGDETLVDEEGGEYDDLEAVRAEARDAARDIMSEGALNGEALDGRVFLITDEGGGTVLEHPSTTQLPNRPRSQ
jgi:hypothetical protein